jgi:hypothetical protein
MTWKEYKNYKDCKKSGKEIKIFKAPWVLDWWDSIDFTKEQYDLFKFSSTIFDIVLSVFFLIIGLIFGYFLR